MHYGEMSRRHLFLHLQLLTVYEIILAFSDSTVFLPEPSALSLEERRLLESLDRLNERLKGL